MLSDNVILNNFLWHIIRRNLVRYLLLGAYELELEFIKGRFHQSMLMVLIFRSLESFFKGSMLWMLNHLSIIGTVFSMVDKSTSMLSIPWHLFVYFSLLEFGLSSCSSHCNFFKVNREGISTGLEDAQVNLRYGIFSLLGLSLLLLWSTLSLFLVWFLHRRGFGRLIRQISNMRFDHFFSSLLRNCWLKIFTFLFVL